MYRVLKSVMAEFSYFLEKYFDITSTLWTILFIAVACAMVVATICKAGEIAIKRHKKKRIRFLPIYLCSSIILSLLVNGLMISPEMWNSKLQRVMSNIEYVTSFPSNRDMFFDALSIPDNETNKSKVFKIAESINDEQWDAVKEHAEDGGWYFKKVEKAIKEILRLGYYHLALPVSKQYGFGVIPALSMIAFSMMLFFKHKKSDAVIAIACSVLCFLYTLGGSIFLAVMCYTGICMEILFNFYQTRKVKE